MMANCRLRICLEVHGHQLAQGKLPEHFMAPKIPTEAHASSVDMYRMGRMGVPTRQKISIGKRKNQGKRNGIVSTQVEIRSHRSKRIQVTAGAQVAGDEEAVVAVEVAKILLTETECFTNSKK